MRSSTTSTTFDKRLFTIRPDGSCFITGLTYINSADNSYIILGPNANGYSLKIGSSHPGTTGAYDNTTCGIFASFGGALHLDACGNNNNVYINAYNSNGRLSVGGVIPPQAKLHVSSGSTSTGNIYIYI